MSVRNAILGLLVKKPSHAYELHAAFEAVVGGEATWNVKPAQVYTTLERLKEAGLVACASDLGEGEEPSRRIFAITPSGSQELQEWFNSSVTPEHQRDEFFVKLMIALVSGEGDPYRILQIQRSFLYKRLHAATARRSHFDPHIELAQIVLLDKAIMHLEADLRWLDLTEARLDEIKRQPKPKVEIRRRGRPRKTDRSPSK